MGATFICNGDGTWSRNPNERVFCTAPVCGWRGKQGDVVDSLVDPVTHRTWEICPLCRTPAHIAIACEESGCWKARKYDYFAPGKCWTLCREHYDAWGEGLPAWEKGRNLFV
jgi:hypothetical protein